MIYDAVALLEDEEALDADRATVLEIVGYRTSTGRLAGRAPFALYPAALGLRGRRAV